MLGAGAGTAIADTTPMTGTGNTRIAGADRYETAVKVSQATFKAPQDFVFIASGESYADALSAGPAAAAAKAPILLVQRTEAPQVVLDELTRLKPKRIAVVGGAAAVSQSVMDALAAYAPKGQTQRIWGANRYATAAKVSKRFSPGVRIVLIASGETYADALAGGAGAARHGGALLLTRPGTLPAETKQALKDLKPQEVGVLGGKGAVSLEVEKAVNAATGLEARRYKGSDRYDTAADVAYYLFGVTPKVFLASGLGFPDALAATPSAAVNGAPILLTRSTCEPYATQEAHWDMWQGRGLSVYLGGEAVTYDGTQRC